MPFASPSQVGFIMEIQKPNNQVATEAIAPVRPKAPDSRSKSVVVQSADVDRFESSTKSAVPISPDIVKFDTNQDGKVDARDSSYENLSVWRDRNKNGIREAEEIQSLAQAGIQKIDPNNPLSDNIIQGHLGAYTTYQAPKENPENEINLQG